MDKVKAIFSDKGTSPVVVPGKNVETATSSGVLGGNTSRTSSDSYGNRSSAVPATATGANRNSSIGAGSGTSGALDTDRSSRRMSNDLGRSGKDVPIVTGSGLGSVHSPTSSTTNQTSRGSVDGYSTSGVTGTTGNSTVGSTGVGHNRKSSLSNHAHNLTEHSSLDGPGEKTHDHKHLAAVTRETHHQHETEEVIREREHDRHIHHIQHHVQPVKDLHHHDVEHVAHAHPVTHVREQHVNTDDDVKLFTGLGAQHKDTQLTGGTTRDVVDKGEIVKENIAHHVHHIVQPVIERDTHHHKTIHTTIPVKHVTHEAPIIHQSSVHEPMSLNDFTKQGGDLTSKLRHHDAGVLATGECLSESEGPATTLMEKLKLGGSVTGTGHGHA